jgi:hypothetical protein
MTDARASHINAKEGTYLSFLRYQR